MEGPQNIYNQKKLCVLRYVFLLVWVSLLWLILVFFQKYDYQVISSEQHIQGLLDLLKYTNTKLFTLGQRFKVLGFFPSRKLEKKNKLEGKTA